MSKPTVQDRLLDIIQQLITQGASPGLAERVARLEAQIAAMEAVWPKIEENDNGTN